jgi:hypothetical protein
VTAELRYAALKAWRNDSLLQSCNMCRGETDTCPYRCVLTKSELFHVIFGHPVHVHEDRVARALSTYGAK